MANSGKDSKDPAHFTFIWTVGNICAPCLVDSPTFTVKDMEMSRWYVRIEFFSGSGFKFYIEREDYDSGPDDFKIKYELSFLGTDGLPIIRKVVTNRKINNDNFRFNGFEIKNEDFLRRRAEFMPKDLLTIRCRMWRLGTKIAQPDFCFARTLLRQDRYFFVWAIREFSTIQRHQTREILLDTTATNQITLKLSVIEDDGEEYVNIDLDFSDIYSDQCFIAKLCLLDFEGKIVLSEETFQNCSDGGEKGLFFEKRRLEDDRDSLLPNDTMSVRCEIQMKAETVWSMIESYRYLHRKRRGNIETDEEVHFERDENSEAPSSVTAAMESLLEKGTLSDVSLKTDTKAFPAHKCILSSRSSLFEAMFNGDTGTSIEIHDVNASTLEELLSYIYTNAVKKLEWESVIDLLRAADKYKLLNLKRICSNFLKSNISKRSVCAVLDVADQYHNRELREAAEEFLMGEGEEFFTSDTWESFKVEKSALAMDVLQQLHCNRL